MIVDDDGRIRRTTTFSSRPSASSSGLRPAEHFLKSGQLHDTSCLIVDVQMPGMNGLELQSELAAAGYAIPIIFITAYDNKFRVSKRCRPVLLHLRQTFWRRGVTPDRSISLARGTQGAQGSGFGG